MSTRHREPARYGIHRWIILLGLAMFIAPTRAVAIPNCEGTFAATLIQPLPTKIVVGLDLRDAPPENLRLKQRFLDGVQSTGIAVGPQATVMLHVTASYLGAARDQSGSRDEQYYSGLSALQGGLNPSVPAIPSTRLMAPRTPPAQPFLILRIDATVGTESRVSWVASIQCQRTGGDDEQLAHEVGRVVGSTFGQRIERRRL